MLIDALHTTDLFWAIISSLGAVYPLYLLIPAHRKPGAKELTGLILVLASYPWAVATFHLTPFDSGLFIAICLFGVPAYLSLILRGANLHGRVYTVTHITSYAVATLLAAMALSNPWHGYFATFDPHTPGQANHLISNTGVGLGMSLTYLFEFVVVGGTLVITGFNYSRARWHRIHIISAFVLPGAALGASLLVGVAVMKLIHVNPYFIATAGALWALTYSFARKQSNVVIRVSHAEIITHMPDAVVIIDKNNNIVDYNLAFTSLFNCGETNISGEPLSAFLPGQPWSADATVTKDTAHGEIHLEIKTKGLQGSKLNQDKLVLVRDVTEGTNAIRHLESNQSQLSEANTELLRMSNTDPLTGLHNRRYFDGCFNDMLASVTNARSIGLLMVDIDHFKRINDTLGHQTGDRVLVELAKEMQAQCREQDILARIGGEEFAIILPNVDRHTLPTIASRFHKAIQIYIEDVGFVTTSIGGLLAMPGETESSLLQRADEALYQAKNEGRNRVVVSHSQPKLSTKVVAASA